MPLTALRRDHAAVSRQPHEMVLTHHGIPVDSPSAAGWTMAPDKLGALIKARNPA